MRLKYSTILITIIHIHLTLIRTSSQQTKHPSDNEPHEHDIEHYQIPEESKKIIIEQVKGNLLKVLGLKEAPRKQHNNKAFVPYAMLEEYRQMRESVRDSIPDDRDFYGKLNIDDLERSHEDFWSAVHNKYGSYDIAVDMSRNDDDTGSRRFHFKGNAKRIAYIGPQSEPEDIPRIMEPRLPPHLRDKQKQFISVHLKFNLSQELYTNPMTADELKAAELHLSRERTSDCEFNDCDKKPVPFFDQGKISSETQPKTNTNVEDTTSRETTTTTAPTTTTTTTSNGCGCGDESSVNNYLPKKPRYQRVYLLHITDYDKKDNIPITSIHEMKRIDTLQTTTLVFDIYKIIKYWLLNPTKNFGIIVRVTNDDNEYEQTQSQSTSSSLNLNDSTTNASSQNILRPQVVGVEEHVRLKREFRFSSETDDTWLQKQPSIYIFSDDPPDTERKHVKRDHSGSSDTENYQADEPEATNTDDYASNNPVQSNQTTEDSQGNNESHTQISKANPAPSTISSNRHRSTNSDSSASRRDNQAVAKGSANQYNRNIGTDTQQAAKPNSQRPKDRNRKPAKCSKRKLEIDFNKVGWENWIIAPLTYNANFCTGDCSFPMSDSQNATNHAIIQSIFQAVGRSNVPRSCCAPTKLASLAILYQLDGVVQMRRYDDMIVESCGCL